MRRGFYSKDTVSDVEQIAHGEVRLRDLLQFNYCLDCVRVGESRDNSGHFVFSFPSGSMMIRPPVPFPLGRNRVIGGSGSPATGRKTMSPCLSVQLPLPAFSAPQL